MITKTRFKRMKERKLFAKKKERKKRIKNPSEEK